MNCSFALPYSTVSMNITSKPAASQSKIVSRVFGPPPSEPALGLGRIKALGSLQRVSFWSYLEDTSFTTLGTWVYCQHGEFIAFEVKRAESFNKGTFACSKDSVIPILID